jgi:orotidine-5'-phosphate decarboxylase
MNPILVALDLDTADAALAMASKLRGQVGGLKVGSHLFTSEGPALVRALVERGDRVFLDLKFHDIPNTVATAVAAATELGVWMINVHAAGGRKMMEAAARAARDASGGGARPLVVAVTVLTSMTAETLAETNVQGALLDQVVRLAGLTRDAGLDGVVASGQEAALIRQRLGRDFVIVTPGIRGGEASAGKDDQARTMSARDALAAGTSYLVVGRPIIAAADPRQAAERIDQEISQARAALEAATSR